MASHMGLIAQKIKTLFIWRQNEAKIKTNHLHRKIKTSSQRKKELERQLKETRIEAEFYKEMVRMAEEIFHIPIRERFGKK